MATVQERTDRSVRATPFRAGHEKVGHEGRRTTKRKIVVPSFAEYAIAAGCEVVIVDGAESGRGREVEGKERGAGGARHVHRERRGCTAESRRARREQKTRNKRRRARTSGGERHRLLEVPSPPNVESIAASRVVKLCSSTRAFQALASSVRVCLFAAIDHLLPRSIVLHPARLRIWKSTFWKTSSCSNILTNSLPNGKGYQSTKHTPLSLRHISAGTQVRSTSSEHAISSSSRTLCLETV